MFAVSLLLSLSMATAVASTSSVFVSKEVLEDRAKGALVASALGDALGRVTEPMGGTAEIKRIFGASGLTALSEIPSCYWLYDVFKHKQAPFSTNTVQAVLAYETALQARQKNLSNEAAADLLGRKIIDTFGEHKDVLDPHYSLRNHSQQLLTMATRLAKLFEKNQTERWWDGQEENNALNDAEGLTRTWPLGVVFSDDIGRILSLVDYQIQLTDKDSSAKAASVALAVGIAYSLRGGAVDQVVNEMVRAAELYEHEENILKPDAKKIASDATFSSHQIAKNTLYTSDMIRYAAIMAKHGHSSEAILGKVNEVQINNRSQEGYLLGNQADEALAAAVYIFVRHADDVMEGLAEAANAGGRTALIASLAGALLGARNGFDHVQRGCGRDMQLLEGLPHFDVLTTDVSEMYSFEPHRETRTGLRKYAPYGLLAGLLGLVGCAAYFYS